MSIRANSIRHSNVGTSRRVSYVEEERNVVKDAVPLIASPAASTVLVDWASKRAQEAAYYAQPDAPPAPAQPPKVSFLALLSFSTSKERWLMAFGTFWAGVSGLSMPVWLLIFSQSLDTVGSFLCLLLLLPWWRLDSLLVIFLTCAFSFFHFSSTI